MNEMSPEKFAEDLAGRHCRRERFSLEMPEGRSGDLDFAYAVQARLLPLVAQGEVKRAGYKIGVTTPRMMQMCNINHPVAGVVLRERLMESPAEVSVESFSRLGVESEIAIRVARQIPADPGLSDSEQLLDYLDSASAAFELVDDSNADYTQLSGVKLVADNAWNARLVLSTPKSLRGVQSLAGLTGTLQQNGKVIDTGTSSDVLGDPFKAVRWLHKHLARSNTALEAGEWISTGSLVPTRFAIAGERYEFEVAGFTPVRLTVR